MKNLIFLLIELQDWITDWLDIILGVGLLSSIQFTVLYFMQLTHFWLGHLNYLDPLSFSLNFSFL